MPFYSRKRLAAFNFHKDVTFHGRCGNSVGIAGFYQTCLRRCQNFAFLSGIVYGDLEIRFHKVGENFVWMAGSAPSYQIAVFLPIPAFAVAALYFPWQVIIESKSEYIARRADHRIAITSNRGDILAEIFVFHPETIACL